MKKHLSFVALILCLLASLRAYTKILDLIRPYLGNNQIDITRYHIKAQIAQMPPLQIDFLTDIELTTLTASRTIELHIESNVLNITDIRFEGQSVSYNILPGISNNYGLSGSVLEILLPRVTVAGEKLQISLNYNVRKNNWTSDDMGVFYIPADQNYGQDILVTRNWPYYGRYWIPSNDSPDDVASVDYKIAVPPSYKVAANGQLKGDEAEGSGLLPNGLRLFEWAQSTPTTVYNFAFAVGNFDIYKKRICFADDEKINDKSVPCWLASNKIPSVLYYNKNNPTADDLIPQIDKANSSTIYFSKLFGKYAFEKVGYVFIPTYPFSMESTSMIVLDTPKSAVHEIIHHWWGNNVHIEHWGEFWISEGFTSYFTGVFDEYKSGTNTTCLNNPAEDLNHDQNTDPNDIFNDTPYCKGAFALHNLRVRIVNLGGAQPAATQAFFVLMRNLYLSHATQQLSTKELVEYVEQNLVEVMKSKGISVTQTQVTKLVTRWKATWFVGLKNVNLTLPATGENSLLRNL